MNRIWPFTFSFLFFASIAFVMPFVVLYYQSLGFTGAQIGVLTGITPIIAMVSGPLVTGFADVTHRHRLILSVILVVVVMALLVMPMLDAFLPILLMVILYGVFFAPVQSFADSATLFMLADEREMYSRIRLGGTIGFGVAASLAGLLVQNYGLKLAFWGASALLLMALIVSQKFVYSRTRAEHPVVSSMMSLLTNPRWLLFLIAALAGGSANAVINNFLFPYMQDLGADASTMGLALTLGTVSEIPVLFWGNRLIRRLGPYRLLMAALGVTGLRLLLFAASGAPSMVLFAQLLNGLTIPIFGVACVSYAAENAPAGMSTLVQGLVGTMVFGFGAAVGGFAGGPLLASVGARGLYLIFGIAVLGIVGIVLLIQRGLPPDRATTLVGSQNGILANNSPR